MTRLWVPSEDPQTEVVDDNHTVYRQSGLLADTRWAWSYDGEGVVFFQSLSPCCDQPIRAPRIRQTIKQKVPYCTGCKDPCDLGRALLRFSLWSTERTASDTETLLSRLRLRRDGPLVATNAEELQEFLSNQTGLNRYEEIIYGPKLVGRFFEEMVELFLTPERPWWQQ